MTRIWRISTWPIAVLKRRTINLKAGKSASFSAERIVNAIFSMKYFLKAYGFFVHNILMVSSPGAGKILLPHAMPGIMPEMSVEESLDATRIYSVVNQPQPGTLLIRHRPFPSLSKFLYAGRYFFRILKLPQLYIPLPLWSFKSFTKPCTCARGVVTKYQKRISGPILDRIDIHVEVPSGGRMGETSEAISLRVQAQLKRFSKNGSSDIVRHADMRVGEIRQFCRMGDERQRSRSIAAEIRDLDGITIGH